MAIVRGAAALVRLARASTRALSASSPPFSATASIDPLNAGASPRQASSSTANVTPAAADRRIAGRRRFYKHVGIAVCAPPAPEDSAGQSGRPAASNDRNGNTTVESPISAGVDGTQSATGVNTTVADASRWSSLLDPPGGAPADWHTVTLDGRTLRTPLGLPLALPALPLALAVAAEWDAQAKYLRPAQMPLMTLCCTALDQLASDPAAHRVDVIRYLMNDTTLYWADPEEDRALRRLQSRAWDGLHSTLTADLLGLPGDVAPASATGGGEALILSRPSAGNPAGGLPHPPVLVDRATRWVHSLDAWTLTALYSACAEAKSFFVGAALIHAAAEGAPGADGGGGAGDGGARGRGVARDAQWAVAAARVEEEFNIENWGLVEGGHDYDRVNCSIQMHAASFLAQTVAQSRAP